MLSPMVNSVLEAAFSLPILTAPVLSTFNCAKNIVGIAQKKNEIMILFMLFGIIIVIVKIR